MAPSQASLDTGVLNSVKVNGVCFRIGEPKHGLSLASPIVVLAADVEAWRFSVSAEEISETVQFALGVLSVVFPHVGFRESAGNQYGHPNHIEYHARGAFNPKPMLASMGLRSGGLNLGAVPIRLRSYG